MPPYCVIHLIWTLSSQLWLSVLLFGRLRVPSKVGRPTELYFPAEIISVLCCWAGSTAVQRSFNEPRDGWRISSSKLHLSSQTTKIMRTPPETRPLTRLFNWICVKQCWFVLTSRVFLPPDFTRYTQQWTRTALNFIFHPVTCVGFVSHKSNGNCREKVSTAHSNQMIVSRKLFLKSNSLI